MKLVGLTHGGLYSHFASRDRTFAHWAAPSIHRRIGRRTDQHM